MQYFYVWELAHLVHMAMLDLVWHGSRRQTNHCEGDIFSLHSYGRGNKFEDCEDVTGSGRAIGSDQVGFVQ